MLRSAGEYTETFLETHEQALSPHVPEILGGLLRGGNLLHIPTAAGWSGSHAGSGSGTQSPSCNFTHTGTTADSRGLLYTAVWGFGQSVANFASLNFSKKLYLVFNYAREVTEAAATARVQLKSATTEGALGERGIGIRVEGFSLYGESFGTEIESVSLGTTLISTGAVQIAIVLYPAAKVEWYVNGVLKAVQTTLSKIPSGTAAIGTSLVHSIVNGPVASADAYSLLFQPRIWQER